MMELGEDFIKFMQIGLAVVGLATIFLIFISYNVTLVHSKVEREAYVLGDYLLASKCLAATDNGNTIKSLFSETKLINIENDPSCISYSNAKVEINLTDSTDDWGFELNPGATYGGEKAIFIVAVKMNDGSIKPANMTVTL